MTGVTWLHLSDWHQGSKEFNRQVVVDALIEDLKKRADLSPDLAKIDFIVFSGDLAFSGIQEEYKAAKEEFLERLLEATGLGPDRLFIIPGNHDLNMDDFKFLPKALLEPLMSDSEVQEWIVEERQRGLVLQPFNAFTKFITEHTKQKDPDFSCIGRLEIEGKKIALLGINSAWMCGRHIDTNDKVDDKGYVLVGEPQIHQSLKEISDADIKIAILHHPFEWLNEFDRRHIEERLINECDFILNGHQHTPYARQISRNNGFYIQISTGASYADRISKDPLFINAYNLVHFDCDTKKGIVFLRRWSDRQNIWLKDIDTCPPDGTRPFNLATLADILSAPIKPEKKTPTHEAGSLSTIIPRQIPQPPHDFKGREEEIADILFNFEKGATITSLRGMGGIGKTALALVLADKIKSQFPDGQIFVDMRGTSNNPELPPLTPAEAMAQVIRAYNPVDRLPENSNELRGLYLSVLAGKRVLLLLDNAANGEQVEPLLPPAGCAVLITSRIKFALPGLAEKDLDILPSDKACELLLQIAPRIGNRAEELAKVCGRLPIALRNAASALAEKRDLSVPEYQRRLKDKMERLKLAEGSFSLSYDLLTPGRKKQWRRLSVFPEDFDRSAATAVLKMASDPSAEALSDLVQWSLVDFVQITDSEDGRYKLHDLARLFAESCLEQDELADAQQKHATHYSKVLSQADKFYQKGGTNVLAGLKLFDREWANIKIGQSWVKNIISVPSKLKTSDSKSVLQLASSYASDGVYVLDLRMHPGERIGWCDTGLKAAKMMGNRSAESAHLGNLGLAYSDLGETRKAIGYLERALNIVRKIGDKRGEEVGLGNLGNRYAHLGETRKAIEYQEQALAISRKIGNRRGEGIDLSNLGSRYVDLGEIRKAIEYYERALAIAGEIGDKRGEGNRLGNLGLSYIALGETRKAIEYQEQGLAITRDIGDRRAEGIHLDKLGLAYADLSETRKAIEYHVQALAIAREIGDKRNEGESLCNLGKAYLDLNENDKAIECCTESLNIVRKIEYRIFEGEALSTLGKAYSDLGQLDKAIDHCDQALKIFKNMEYRRGEGEALFTKSQVLHKLGPRTEAAALANEALQIFVQIESPLAEKARQQLAEWGASAEGN